MIHFIKDTAYYFEKRRKNEHCHTYMLERLPIFLLHFCKNEKSWWILTRLAKHNVYSVKIPWHTILFLQNFDEQCVVQNSSSKLHRMFIIMITVNYKHNGCTSAPKRSKLLIKGNWASSFFLYLMCNSLFVYSK